MRLLLTLPWHANSNAGITLALNREAEGAKRKARRRKPIQVSTVDTQVSRAFAKLNIHSRMELAQRVDAEIAVMRGWIKETGPAVDGPSNSR